MHNTSWDYYDQFVAKRTENGYMMFSWRTRKQKVGDLILKRNMDSDCLFMIETGLLGELFVLTSWILLKEAEESFSFCQSISDHISKNIDVSYYFLITFSAYYILLWIFLRNFLKSKWGMEEFMIADAEAVGGRKNFIILILKDKFKHKELTPELRTYIRTYTYIKAIKNTDKLMKRIR